MKRGKFFVTHNFFWHEGGLFERSFSIKRIKLKLLYEVRTLFGKYKVCTPTILVWCISDPGVSNWWLNGATSYQRSALGHNYFIHHKIVQGEVICKREELFRLSSLACSRLITGKKNQKSLELQIRHARKTEQGVTVTPIITVEFCLRSFLQRRSGFGVDIATCFLLEYYISDTKKGGNLRRLCWPLEGITVVF
jgi:hypothetical protein